jgi:hypothetical protein
MYLSDAKSQLTHSCQKIDSFPDLYQPKVMVRDFTALASSRKKAKNPANP